MFNPTQLGSPDFSDYKNFKAYSHYKFGWSQPLCFHKLSGCVCCIFKGECRQSQIIYDIKQTLDCYGKSGKIMLCH